jgi:hypothetical protein
VHAVQFLSVVFVALQGIGSAGIAVDGAEWIVVDNLLNSTVMVHHGTVVTQMVFRIVMERRLAVGYGGIAALEEELAQLPVLENEVADVVDAVY